MLYLVHCIIFFYNSNFQKKLHFNSFENIMENGANVPFFKNILENLKFQRHPKALVWSKGLIKYQGRKIEFRRI